MNIVGGSSTSRVIRSDYTVKSRSVGDLVQDRVLPRQISTGSTRGTQTVGYGSVKIDGSNNRIDLQSNDTRTILGDISDTNDVTGLGIYDNSNTLRLFGGTYPDGSVKIKLSQDGYDVTTATDDQLIWSSDFNTFKIVDKVPISLTASYTAGSPYFTSTSVPHGLDYEPSYEAYITIPAAVASPLPNTNLPNPGLAYGTAGGSIVIICLAYVNVDDTNVTLSVQMDNSFATASYAFSANVYLKRETQLG